MSDKHYIRKIERVILIGSGKVAHHLSLAMSSVGIVTESVWSRSYENAEALAAQNPETHAVKSLDFSQSSADLCLLSLSDDAYRSVLEQLIIPKHMLLVHTSGSIPLSLLKKNHTQSGVFYPLQTFSKEKDIDFSEVSFFTEATKPEQLERLNNLASELGAKFYPMSSEDRGYMHLAAVFACNFSNHCFAEAEKILAAYDIPLKVIKPLIEETVSKAFLNGAARSQTGPAVRHDKGIIKAHLEKLKDDKGAAEIYEIMTRGIIREAERRS